MSVFRKNKGFTIVELIVVMAIIVILITVAAVSYINVTQEAKIQADNESIVILNQSSVAYAVLNKIAIPDIFQGIDEDSARIQKLVDENFLSISVEPQQKDAEFNWLISNQVWVLNGGAGSGVNDEATPPPDDGDIDLSGYPAWSANTIYNSPNTYVIYDGKLYYNLWWVNGSTLPGTSQVWQQVSDSWVNFNIYTRGDTIEYEGNTYRARFWTSGQAPVGSDYGPWELIP